MIYLDSKKITKLIIDAFSLVVSVPFYFSFIETIDLLNSLAERQRYSENSKKKCLAILHG